MSGAMRTADGGLVIRDACPAGITVLSAASGSAGRWLVLSSGGTTARCWSADAQDMTGVPQYSYHWSSNPESLALAPLPEGGDVVLARGGFGKLLIWEREPGGPAGRLVSHPALATNPGRCPPLAVADIPGNPLAITDSAEGGLRRWDASTGQTVGEAFGTQSAVGEEIAGFFDLDFGL